MVAASIWLARLILGDYKWVGTCPYAIKCSLTPLTKTANLAHYSSYTGSALLPTANLTLNYIVKPIQRESFHRKYPGKRLLKVSIPAPTRCLTYIVCRQAYGYASGHSSNGRRAHK